jgi:hypothetical protein
MEYKRKNSVHYRTAAMVQELVGLFALYGYDISIGLRVHLLPQKGKSAAL